MLVAAPCEAGDLDGIAQPTTQFFVRIPIGETSAKERQPVYGFAIRGRRDYETLVIDTKTLDFLEGALGAGIDAKLLIIGGVAATAAVVASRKDPGAAQKREEQQQQAAQQPAPAPCPKTPPTC